MEVSEHLSGAFEKDLQKLFGRLQVLRFGIGIGTVRGNGGHIETQQVL